MKRQLNPRIPKIVSKAEERHPNCFRNLNSALGRHGDSGYCIFKHKGTSHKYTLYSKEGKIYIAYWISEAGIPKKKMFQNREDKFKEVVDGLPLDTVTETHTQDYTESEVLRVDVTGYNDDKTIDYMVGLSC